MKANGALILIPAILSWTMFSILSAIPAWIMANNSLKAMDQGIIDSSERSLVRAGRILAIVHVAVFVIASFVSIILIVVLASGIGMYYREGSRI